MTQPSKQQSSTAWRFRPPLIWKWSAALYLAIASSMAPLVSRAQAPLPPVDAEAIYQRLERQEAEIQWLRTQLTESRAAPPAPLESEQQHIPPALRDYDQNGPQAQFTSATAAEIDTVSRRLDTLDANRAQPIGQKATDDGWTDLSNETWTVKLGGHVQLDYVNWAKASPAIIGTPQSPAPPAAPTSLATPGPQDYFEFRRLRLTADGKGYGVFDFRLQMTLEPETVGETRPLGTITSPDVKDAYLSMNEIPWLGRVRIGNFFVPFGLEQVTNDTFNVFMERSIPTQGIFTADREVGVAFYNATENKNFTWTYGAFFDSISDSLKERIDDNQGYRLSGRATWLPYYDEPSNGRYLMHTGLGILYTDDQDKSVRFRARPQVHEGPRLIDSGALAASTYTTGNVEFATVWGPFTVQAEAFLSNVNLTAGNSVNVQGAYTHFSYFLTGENRIFERFGQHGPQFGRNVPYTNFFAVPGCIGSGAWEAKARWSYLDLNNVNRGQYNDLTVGFNWYWSDRTRIVFDWIHPITSSQSTFGATESDLLAMRFDFNW